MKKKWLLFFLTEVFLLWIVWPVWHGYQITPNRIYPIWDASQHLLEGAYFYEQLRSGDFFSFLIQLLSLKFWMPLHPLLVMLCFFFFPYQFEPVVFLNFFVFTLSFSTGIILFFDFLSQSKIDFKLSKKENLFCCLTLSCLMVSWLSRQPFLISLLNTVMLDILGFGLTLLFLLVSALFLIESELRYFKILTGLLLALFLTKIHYGLFVLPALFLLIFWTHSLLQFSTINWKQYVQSLWRRTYLKILSFFYILFIFLFLIKVFFNLTKIEIFQINISMSRPDKFLWFFIWIPLLVWSIECWKKRNPVVALFPPSLRILHHYCLFPFAWFYLFPFRDKVGSFLHNFSYFDPQRSKSFVEKVIYYPQVLCSDYFGIQSLPSQIFSVILCFLLLGILLRHPLLKKVGILWLMSATVFYVGMSFINQNYDPRMAIPLCAHLVMLFMLGSIVFFNILSSFLGRWRIGFLCFLGLLFCFQNPIDPLWVKKETQRHYFPEDTLGLDWVVDQLNLNQSILIEGLQWHPLVSLLTLKILKKDEDHQARLSTLLFRNKNILINDLGYLASLPREQVLVEVFKQKPWDQLVLFRHGIRPELLDTMIHWAHKAGMQEKKLHPAFWMAIRP